MMYGKVDIEPFPYTCGNYVMEIRGIYSNFQARGFHGYNMDKRGILKNMTETKRKKKEYPCI